MTKKTDGDLLKLVESEIRKVLTNPETTNKERIQVIAEAGRLMQIKHKIGEDAPKKGFFDKD